MRTPYTMRTPACIPGPTTFAALLCCASLMAASVVATPECRAAEKETEEWAEEGQNELGLFLGETRRDGEGGFSVGLDYERRLSRRIGIGGVLEHTGGDLRDGIAGVPVCWHPWRELKILIAPGVEFSQDESDEFLVRLGAEYGFDVGKGFEIAPALNFDRTSGETSVVYGVSLAKSF